MLYYVMLANVCLSKQYFVTELVYFSIYYSGGTGDGGGLRGEEGTITGRKCPKGLYGTFCAVIFHATLIRYCILSYVYNKYLLPYLLLTINFLLLRNSLIGS